MAKMPTSANLILNPTSGAPGFYVENVFCFPGVYHLFNRRRSSQ